VIGEDEKNLSTQIDLFLGQQVSLLFSCQHTPGDSRFILFDVYMFVLLVTKRKIKNSIELLIKLYLDKQE